VGLHRKEAAPLEADTETTSEIKKGGYVQGTVVLVARLRRGSESGWRDEVVAEVKDEVARQVATMVGLNQSLKGHGRIENLFEDADLQMAGYAAALRVLTGYTRIDGVDMTREATRPRVKGDALAKSLQKPISRGVRARNPAKSYGPIYPPRTVSGPFGGSYRGVKGERSLVSEVVEFAVQVANEQLVPEGMDARVWERLEGAERFYLKMVDVEAAGARKLDNYQNFAKAFRVPEYAPLMRSLKPNEARLKTSWDFRKGDFGVTEFGPSLTRAVLFAMWEVRSDVDGGLVLAHLRDLVGDLFDYDRRRDDLAAIAAYLAARRGRTDEDEARAARIVFGLIRNERVGA